MALIFLCAFHGDQPWHAHIARSSRSSNAPVAHRRRQAVLVVDAVADEGEPKILATEIGDLGSTHIRSQGTHRVLRWYLASFQAWAKSLCPSDSGLWSGKFS